MFYQTKEWRPIHVLERALQNVARQSLEATGSSSLHAKPTKGREGKKQYLPIGKVHINPFPLSRTGRSDARKWPVHATWVCVYCRQIFKKKEPYANHLKNHHRNGMHPLVLKCIQPRLLNVMHIIVLLETSRLCYSFKLVLLCILVIYQRCTAINLTHVSTCLDRT